ncbi:GGDEF domain-containing protein [Sneathiella marina]|uniref:diguanylate cyclase n=1 Tax=Sneathiella marina TaxID=2950108 RepID=A0ABY4VXM1_9PROT|nr:GGDEF domain-containing protein [Sneathiella marina]USG59668.1 GGDEF domain-containing protein [Sneathiella marina]
MAQSNSFKTIEANAKNTMALLKDQSIRQLPRNYTIWYEYLTESNPDLVRRVNELMETDGKFTDKIASEIYRDFFTFEKENKAIQESNRIVQKSMDSVMVNLNATTGDFSNYGEQLSDFATKADSLSVTELQDVIGEIVSQTSTMSDNAMKLNDSLDSASKEISNLRKLLAEVQEEALTDGLTGIANRKSFDAALAKATSMSLETNTPTCLLLSDIDHFKKFNDTHGHPFGDQVLKLVAKTLTGGIGRTATAARYGGEEFGIILPNTELDEAVDLANDLRTAVSSKKLVKRSTGEDVGKITMSFGVALYTPREDALTYINRADEALYAAKNAGRNQVKHLQSGLAQTG